MNEYEKSEFEKHKKAAEKQLNEMYYGTRGKKEGTNNFAMPSFVSLPKNTVNNQSTKKASNTKSNKEKCEAKNPEPKPQPIIKPEKNLFSGRSILNMLNFKGMKIDNDRLIILAVCMLLAGEDADELLMLALIYIML